MNNRKKIFIGVGIIIFALIVFGIYNNPDRKNGFTPQQETYLNNLEGEFGGLTSQNEKVKIITLEVVNALDEADNSTFNTKSQQLLPELQILQDQLIDTRSAIAEGKTIFFNEEKLKKIFEVLDEIYQFRYDYNEKVIEMAEFGSTVNFDNEEQLVSLYVLLYELEEMESQLPELHEKLTNAFSAIDSQLANDLAEYPFLWK